MFSVQRPQTTKFNFQSVIFQKKINKKINGRQGIMTMQWIKRKYNVLAEFNHKHNRGCMKWPEAISVLQSKANAVTIKDVPPYIMLQVTIISQESYTKEVTNSYSLWYKQTILPINYTTYVII